MSPLKASLIGFVYGVLSAGALSLVATAASYSISVQYWMLSWLALSIPCGIVFQFLGVKLAFSRQRLWVSWILGIVLGYMLMYFLNSIGLEMANMLIVPAARHSFTTFDFENAVNRAVYFTIPCGPTVVGGIRLLSRVIRGRIIRQGN